MSGLWQFIKDVKLLLLLMLIACGTGVYGAYRITRGADEIRRLERAAVARERQRAEERMLEWLEQDRQRRLKAQEAEMAQSPLQPSSAVQPSR